MSQTSLLVMKYLDKSHFLIRSVLFVSKGNLFWRLLCVLAKAVPLLQIFFVCASVISYLAHYENTPIQIY